MPVTPVIMVFHNHQPVGNLPWITEECFRTAYLPFLEVLERHPRLRVGLHFTGPLFDWLRREQTEYLARVRALVAAGQVEVLGGGFFEPILAVIPENDRIGQLQRLRDAVEETFGIAPEGAWLAERVWEPSLPPALHVAGMRYVLVDDEVFHRMGYAESATRTTFITEDQGAPVRLLPISRRLRYTLPTRPVEEICATLRAMAQDSAEVLIYAEDGERYGNWPGTFAYMYGEEAYLERLFSALDACEDLEFVLPGSYVRETPPSGRVYLPPASYREMDGWSGGFWRNFLARYRESNLMQGKMYQVSRWVAQAAAAGHDVRDAQQELYAGQCNCAYWYGAFGGLYLPHLRRAVYHHLLRAEQAVAPMLPAGARPACELADVDSDGRDEVLLRGGDLVVGMAPAQGGGVFALEHLGLAHNFLATLARYPVADAAGEEQEALPVDWHPRFAFLDHFLAEDASPEALQRGESGEQGDFVLGAYTIIDRAEGEVTLRRDGHSWNGPDWAPVRLEKRYRVSGEMLEVCYTLTNTDTTPRHLRFGVELHVTLSAGEAPGRTLTFSTAMGEERQTLTAIGSTQDASGMRAVDEWLGGELAVTWSAPTTVWTYPICTPLRSLEGFEWVYQSTVALPVWQLPLAPGESWSVSFVARCHVREAVVMAASV